MNLEFKIAYNEIHGRNIVLYNNYHKVLLIDYGKSKFINRF